MGGDKVGKTSEGRETTKITKGGCKGTRSSTLCKHRSCRSRAAAMGLDGDGSKGSDDSWSFYTAQAQSMGKKALSSTDDAIKTARVQINQLQDASSQHFATAQVRSGIFLGRRPGIYLHVAVIVPWSEPMYLAAQNPSLRREVLFAGYGRS